MNQITVRGTTNNTDWQIIATDGAGYASLAALAADSKVAFPGLDKGMYLAELTLVTDNGSGAQGAGLWYAIGGQSAPSAGQYCPSGVATIGGIRADASSQQQIGYVWIKKVTGGNGCTLHGTY